jgi:imidazolonepropionase-like amidohydrolase
MGPSDRRRPGALGLPGLEPGAPADLVTYAADPRGDLAELSRPAAILHGGLRLA